MVPVEEEEEEGAEEEVVEEEGGEEKEAIRTMKEDNKITKIAKTKATPIPLILAQIQMLINQTMAIHVTIQVSKSQIWAKFKVLTFQMLTF